MINWVIIMFVVNAVQHFNVKVGWATENGMNI